MSGLGGTGRFGPVAQFRQGTVLVRSIVGWQDKAKAKVGRCNVVHGSAKVGRRGGKVGLRSGGAGRGYVSHGRGIAEWCAVMYGQGNAECGDGEVGYCDAR